jgi:hypothetical protein
MLYNTLFEHFTFFIVVSFDKVKVLNYITCLSLFTCGIIFVAN